MILTPEYIFKTIECIHPDFLAAHGIKALVLDVDNTLTADNSQVLLNTASAISVQFDGKERLIQHLAGEILVETAHLSEYKTAMEHDDEETLIRLLDEGKKRKEEVDG